MILDCRNSSARCYRTSHKLRSTTPHAINSTQIYLPNQAAKVLIVH
uniref:Uncharacterized protein n=1 Tax=Zea mays TaxID=4577 RepID=C0PB08_MAIZE|nr:unknown [Zea mays]